MCVVVRMTLDFCYMSCIYVIKHSFTEFRKEQYIDRCIFVDSHNKVILVNPLDKSF